MKKFLALFLVICMSAFIFASCKEEPPQETTGTGETTSGSTSSSGTTATTAATETTHVFNDPQVIDSLDYDYIIRTIEENKEIVGVAVYTWKTASDSIVFDSEYVLDDKTYPVLQIGVGQGILTFQKQLKSVTIPSSVQKISKIAFSYCSALETLNLSEGLEEIGEMAFWNCSSLESVSIPSTVTTIGKNAFADCSNLKTVTIPRAFENQIDDIFAGCGELEITYID